MASKSAKTDSVTQHNLDFTNVKDGGQSFNKKRVPAGDYLARVTKVQDSPAKDGVPQWLFTIQLENKHTDRKFPYYCKLQDNQLWKVRNLLLAAGKAVPKKKVRVNPEVVVGKLIGITLEDDEYEGKAQSVVEAIFPSTELEDSDVDTDEDEDTEDDEEETEDEDTDDEADSDEEDDSEDEDDEGDEEEPEPAPVKKKAAKAAIPAPRKSAPAPVKKATKKKPVNEVDEDDLEELDLESI
jgi:hypothetical protein